MVRIDSLQNPKVKFAYSLYKSSVRKRENLFLIEGEREIKLAVIAGYKIDTLFICPELTSRKYSAVKFGTTPVAEEILGQTFTGTMVVEASPGVFKKLAYRDSADGLIAVAYQRRLLLDDVRLSKNPLVVVAEALEKPGNLGAILRTSDAAGVDAVIVCDGITDIFNPNVIRSSLGTIFTNQISCASQPEVIGWLKRHSIRIYTTALSASVPYYQADFCEPSAIVAGAESDGVTESWQKQSDSNIIIPMYGSVDSMNVSVATSIVIYEALRQRGFKKIK